MKSRLPQTFIRTYISRRVDKRRAERPPYRAPDPLINNPNAVVKSLPDENLTFIHRPPPTSPSPFSLTTAPSSPLLRPPLPRAPDVPLPPFIRPSADKAEPPRVSDEIMAEIRRLRLSNPDHYSRGRLAKMFGCTESFVGKIAALPKAQRHKLVQKREEVHAKARERWGEKKELVRAIRAKRREYW